MWFQALFKLKAELFNDFPFALVHKTKLCALAKRVRLTTSIPWRRKKTFVSLSKQNGAPSKRFPVKTLDSWLNGKWKVLLDHAGGCFRGFKVETTQPACLRSVCCCFALILSSNLFPRAIERRIEIYCNAFSAHCWAANLMEILRINLNFQGLLSCCQSFYFAIRIVLYIFDVCSDE